MSCQKKRAELQRRLALDQHYSAVSAQLKRAAEAFTIWWFLANRFVTHDDDPATMMHSELLGIIGYSCRRTGVITLAMVTDDDKNGFHFSRLLDEIEKDGAFDVTLLRRRLNRLNRTITKIRIVRNNVDAHLPIKSTWRLSPRYDGLQYNEVRRAMIVLFLILKGCAMRLNLGYERFDEIERFTKHYCEQMMRGFEVQHQTGEISFLD